MDIMASPVWPQVPNNPEMALHVSRKNLHQQGWNMCSSPGQMWTVAQPFPHQRTHNKWCCRKFVSIDWPKVDFFFWKVYLRAAHSLCYLISISALGGSAQPRE